MRVAIVGAGWAGIAAAVRATEAGHAVTLYEMAHQLGGRARGVQIDGLALDNGQHILIGAYRRTLALMRTVGADERALLLRRPLELRYPDGRGLAMPPGPPWLGFARAVAGARGWSWRDRAALARAALGWALAGFRCPPGLSAAGLCAGLPAPVRRMLIEPLCVAALNTPAAEASAAVLLRVLRDGLFGGPGASDLLLPRRSLHELLPGPAQAWLAARGAQLRLGTRVQRIERTTAATEGARPGSVAAGWQVDEDACDAVVLACPAREAARLVAPLDPAWAAGAEALRYEPILTAYMMAPGRHLIAPMTALDEAPDAPAQFAFDHGALSGRSGLFAFVVSGAARWVELGAAAAESALLAQAGRTLAGDGPPPRLLRLLAEKRATFRCTPGLARPRAHLAPGLWAAGDHVEGPYPSTLEGAVLAGEAAVGGL